MAQAAHETPPQVGIGRLLADIAADAQDLVKQQLALFRCELRNDLASLKEASLMLLAGVGLAQMASIFLGFMLIYLIAWAFPTLPMWVCFACLGVPLAVGAITFAVVGLRKLKRLNPMPNESVEAMKETMTWIAKPK